jgi:heme exporter protein CcmD
MDQSLVMGGYAAYILAAYGVTALVVVGNVVAARRRFRRTQQRLREQLGRRTEQGRGRDRAAVGRSS